MLTLTLGGREEGIGAVLTNNAAVTDEKPPRNLAIRWSLVKPPLLMGREAAM